jgi:hypothetical protein
VRHLGEPLSLHKIWAHSHVPIRCLQTLVPCSTDVTNRRSPPRRGAIQRLTAPPDHARPIPPPHLHRRLFYSYFKTLVGKQVRSRTTDPHFPSPATRKPSNSYYSSQSMVYKLADSHHAIATKPFPKSTEPKQPPLSSIHLGIVLCALHGCMVSGVTHVDRGPSQAVNYSTTAVPDCTARLRRRSAPVLRRLPHPSRG